MATETTFVPQNAAQNDGLISKYLTFFCDGLLFGVNASHIVEIIINHAMTPVPMTPDYVAGIINLRGQIIPIVNTRLRLGRPLPEENGDVCIIVLNVDGVQLGILVDRVSQMVDIDEELVSSRISSQQELVSGMISLPETHETILLLDCDQLVAE